MLRILLSLVIAAHGIGHLLFLASLWSIGDWRQLTHSWLIGGETAARWVGSFVWAAAIIGFGIAVFGLMSQQPSWRQTAMIAAVISTLGLVIFWSNPVTSPAVSALVFNVLVLGALLIARWPSIEAVGA